MFTGLIQATGEVVESKTGRLRLRMPLKGVTLGESVSVNGVCLTIASRQGALVSFDIGPETARLTTLGDLRRGERVNLEQALRMGDRLGGHWVQGHVDGVGVVTAVRRESNASWFTIRLPAKLERYLISKGSVAVDGISLTVARLRTNQFDVMIIPHTLAETTLSGKKIGDRVNIEVDVLAKYSERLLQRKNR